MSFEEEVYMFSRDFVRCAIETLLPGWQEIPAFPSNSEEVSPFSDTIRREVEYMLEKIFSCFVSETLEYIDNRPMTMELYLDMTEEQYIFAFKHGEEVYQSHLAVFLITALGAVFFLRDGHPGPYHLAAADIIAKFILLLQEEGLHGEEVWRNFETTIMEMRELRLILT